MTGLILVIAGNIHHLMVCPRSTQSGDLLAGDGALPGFSSNENQRPALWSWDYFAARLGICRAFRQRSPRVSSMIFNPGEYRFTSPRYPLMRCILLDVSSDVANVEQTYLNMIFDIGRCL